MKHILVTSISAKVPLLQKVKEARDKFNKDIKVYGTDINEGVIGSYFVNEFFISKRVSTIKFEDLLEICKEKEIKYIIPTRDEDVFVFSNFKDKLEENGIYLFAPKKQSVDLCYDKLAFSKLDKTINAYENVEALDFEKFVMKDRFGAGSASICINILKEEAIKKANNLKNPIFQEFIEGKEYSVDSYVNKNSKVEALIIRSRDFVVDGESKITTRVIDEKIQVFVKEFLELHEISGHSVLQLIKKDDSYHIIECNTRFGGASTLSYTLGLESFYWFLQECENQKIEVNISSKILKQIRVSQDIYFE